MASNLTLFPTQDQKRGFDCQLLRDKIDFYQLEIFHKHFSRDPATLFAELKKHKTSLKKLRPRILKDDQWKLLFPASGFTDSCKFDTTLTSVLIRNLCGYKIPPTGWDQQPDPSDVTVIADGVRLRLARNRIQHGRLKTTRREYKVLYQLLEKPFIRLGCPANELNQLRPVFKYRIPNAASNFFGREDQLKRVNDTFFSPGRTKPDAVVITGIPGIGKSELAVQYFKKYGTKYEHAIFINGQSIEASFKDIAMILKLDNTTDINVIVNLLKEYFKNEKVIFVYDNVTDAAYLANVLIKDFYNIITTQIQNWGANYEQIEVDVLTLNDALQLLGMINNTQLNRNDLESLAEKLGNHPLAIEHAASFINQSGITLNKYFDFLENQKLQVLSEKVTLIQNGIKTSIFSSFLLTIQNLQNEDPDAFGILAILGLLDGSFIEESFIQTFCTDDWQYTRIKRLLLEYSMIKSNQRVSELDGHVIDYITIHSLYQQAVIYNLSQYNSIQTKVESCMQNIYVSCHSHVTNNYNTCIQFLHLWEQPSLQITILNYIQKNPFFIMLFHVTYSYKLNDSLRDLFLRIIDSYDIHNILVYWAKYFLMHIADMESREMYLYGFPNLRGEIIMNVYYPDQLKTQLLLLLDVFPSPNMSQESNKYLCFALSMKNGQFVQAINQMEDLAKVCKTGGFQSITGVCYKEIGQYDEALKYLLVDPEGAGFSSPNKVEIACCFILKGEIERGIKLLESIPELVRDDFISIGRALFDVESYKRSEEFFDKFMEKIDLFTMLDSAHSLLDGLCKISVLKFDNSVTNSFLLLLANNSRTNDDQLPFISDQLSFRYFMFIVCNLIQIDEVREAFNKMKWLVARHKDQSQLLREVCFKEVFFLASQWKSRGHYYTALTMYRVIKMLRRQLNDIQELFLHDFNDVDLVHEMKECFENL